MKMRSGNPRVAIMTNKSTMEMCNAEAVDGSPEVSYAAVATSSRRSTCSRAAKNASPARSGNADVAANTLAARDTKAKPPSPPVVDQGRKVP